MKGLDITDELVSDERVIEVLEAAADELEVRGHVKHDLGSNIGPKCVMGALLYAATGSVISCVTLDVQRAVRVLEKNVPAVTTSNWMTVVHWNDDPQTESFEVIDALRFAAKKLHDAHEPADVDRTRDEKGDLR